MNNQLLYRYFSNVDNPMSSILDVESKGIAECEKLAAKIGMVGYDRAYFERRKIIEQKCKSVLYQKGIVTQRNTPIYMVLGKQDELYFNRRHHKCSVAIPLDKFDLKQLLFVVGDSMVSTVQLERRIFTYDEFMELDDTQIESLLPQSELDRYVEVQVWQADTEQFIKGEADRVFYTFMANFPDFSCVRNLADEIKCLKNSNRFEIFGELLKTGDVSVLPGGIVHGIPHSVRCAFLAFILANRLEYDTSKALWIAKCAAYHDCGRSMQHSGDNCGEEGEHAELSRQYVDRLFPERERQAAFDVMRCHNKNPEQISEVFGRYSCNQKEYEIAARIVHDADTLDYIRFSNELGILSFSANQLVMDVAHEYISVAYELFLYSTYRKNWMELFWGVM